MIRDIFFIACLVIVVGCTKYQPSDSKLEVAEEFHKDQEQRVSRDFDRLKLSDKLSAESLGGARNIGEFFDHRLIFYKIDYPAIRFARTGVEELVFYFVDSALVKLRYKVRGNVSDYLLDSLGLSKFKPLDEHSKQLLKEGDIVKKYGSYYELNKALRNYELIWRESNTVSRFRVTSGDSLLTCFYYHEMDDYQAKLRELERLYHALDNATVPD
ncbi:hypothetical protein C900_04031 [Fulvivirga imtechensis AK7]|uniref:Lipoprotein n=1 Tax=Fulvivirga imtechensis AK7 TaxID=1237149 RepID=L8JN34_9BACT|nr:hypothetical protein [Fulvivirga imtechensis]ELR70346.1 hypothetical protein C900_04031 [Fulvivirga imtechensis AK7]